MVLKSECSLEKEFLFLIHFKHPDLLFQQPVFNRMQEKRYILVMNENETQEDSCKHPACTCCSGIFLNVCCRNSGMSLILKAPGWGKTSVIGSFKLNGGPSYCLFGLNRFGFTNKIGTLPFQVPWLKKKSWLPNCLGNQFCWNTGDGGHLHFQLL